MAVHTLQDWRAALVDAQRIYQSDDPFWSVNHISNIREKNNGNGGRFVARMVEELWESMGPLEHAWLERFVPDFRQKYPLETEWVTPWNAAIAVNHYGLTPTFNHRLLEYAEFDARLKSLAKVVPVWLSLRRDAGLNTDCWQLTHEIVQSFHSRDHLAQHFHHPYSTNVGPNAMACLQMLCPSQDWTLALACAGVNTLELNTAVQAGSMSNAQEDAVAWLQWWLDKSPDCLDNLAWANFPKHDVHVPKTTPGTLLHLSLLDYARDARDTFPLARALYTQSETAPQTLALPSLAI